MTIVTLDRTDGLEGVPGSSDFTGALVGTWGLDYVEGPEPVRRAEPVSPRGRVEEPLYSAARGEPRLDQSARSFGFTVKEAHSNSKDDVETAVAKAEVFQAHDEKLGDTRSDGRGVTPRGCLTIFADRSMLVSRPSSSLSQIIVAATP